MKALRLGAVLAVSVSMVGCVPDWARQNQTGLFMEIAQIVGLRGGEAGGTAGSVLYSDVSEWINDDARVTVNVYRLNPNVQSTSALEHLRLESYEVRYFRSDGRNTEGVDVPYRITGPINAVRFHTPTGTGEIEAEVVINLVRQTAKREPPLMNLMMTSLAPVPRNPLLLTGQGIITTFAEITVYARQVTTGEALRASGRVQVMFADFVDEG